MIKTQPTCECQTQGLNLPSVPQAQYNVTLTSQTNADQVLNNILTILPEKHVDFTQKG